MTARATDRPRSAPAEPKRSPPPPSPRQVVDTPTPIAGSIAYTIGRASDFGPLLPVSRPSDHHEVAARGGRIGTAPPPVTAATPRVPASRVQPRSAGVPLPSNLRGGFEAQLGADLGGVRLHTGADAARSARGIGARAYTIGPSIVFGNDQYAPATATGRDLLRHELIHTVQDPGGRMVHRYIGEHESISAEDAAGRSDEELQEGAAGSRRALAAGRSEALDNRELFRYELVRRGVDEVGPSPSVQQMNVGGIVWSLDSEHARWQAEQVHAGRFGIDATTALENLERAVDELRYDAGYDPIAGTPEPGSVSEETSAALTVAGEIYDLAREQLDTVGREVAEFMEQFEPSTKNLAFSILEESENRINNELARYGVHNEMSPDDDYDWRVDEGYENEIYNFYSFDDDPASTEQRARLMAAAQEIAVSETRLRALRARHQLASNRLDAARAAAECEESETYDEDDDYDAAIDEGGIFPRICDEVDIASTDLEQLADLVASSERAFRRHQQAHDLLRAAKEGEFPLLAMYTSGDTVDLAGLEQLATAPDAGAIAYAADRKLGNIAEVRDGLSGDDPDLSVWELPLLLDLARQRWHVARGSPRDAAINAAVEDAGEDNLLRAIGITILAVGLGLLAAIPTGGGSLAVTATVVAAEVAGLALEAYLIYDSLRDYSLRSALTDTDFDRARALSHDEPSLFWLAVDVIGAVVGFAGAAATFRAIATTRRVALAARTADDVAEQLAELHRLRAEAGLPLEVGLRAEQQILDELPDQTIAAQLRGGPSAARSLDEIATSLGRSLHGPVGPDDVVPLSRELGLPLHVDESLGVEVRVMTVVLEGGIVRARHVAIGPAATLGDILAHRETVALLRRLEDVTEGLSRQLDDLLGTLVDDAGTINPFPPGTQAFNSWFELRKYPQMIELRLNRLADDGIDAAERARLREDVRFFETELEHHREIIDRRVFEAGGDVIARSAAQNDEAIRRGYPREFTVEADGATYAGTIGAPDSPYYYARAGDGTDRLVVRRYADRHDVPAVSFVANADGTFQFLPAGLSRTEAGEALVASWPETLRTAFGRARDAAAATYGDNLFRVVPLQGIAATGVKVGDLLDLATVEEMVELVAVSLRRNHPAHVAQQLAEDAVARLVLHPITVVRGTDQLRAFGYRARFISSTGEVVEGDLHHLIPLYLGGDHRVMEAGRNLFDIDPTSHRRIHELLEGVRFGDVTLDPNDLARLDLPYEEGIGILLRDGSVRLESVASYAVSESSTVQ